ncbi:hypothetical protein [Litoreibacter albidus]|uniref:hypothetical protein n=1 Tax=Litoreibacter albidus TaxID=670155 RepID=UPI003735891C
MKAKMRQLPSGDAWQFPPLEAAKKEPPNPYFVSLSIWLAICPKESLNGKWGSTAVPALVEASAHLFGRFNEHGPAGLAKELRRLDGEGWTQWVHTVADKLDSSNCSPEGAIAALQVFGLMYLINLYLAEHYEHDLNQLKKVLVDLYCVQSGVVRPAMSYSGWMTRAQHDGNFGTRTEFLSRSFEDNETHIRDGWDMFSGEGEIPPYRKSKKVLHRIKTFTSEAEETGWELGLLLVTMVAKSSRHLQKFPSIQDITDPHQIAYDAVLTTIERASTAR